MLSDSPVSLTDILLLVQASIVIGGGFYFAGRLGAKIDHLATAIEALHRELTNHDDEMRELDQRITRLESRFENNKG